MLICPYPPPGPPWDSGLRAHPHRRQERNVPSPSPDTWSLTTASGCSLFWRSPSNLQHHCPGRIGERTPRRCPQLSITPPPASPLDSWGPVVWEDPHLHSPTDAYHWLSGLSELLSAFHPHSTGQLEQKDHTRIFISPIRPDRVEPQKLLKG